MTPQFQVHARWLSYLGVLPFAFALLMISVDSNTQLAASAMQTYAVVILVFVGAIHWGRALHTGDHRALYVSVTVALFAWMCMILPAALANLVLALGFILVYFYDAPVYRKDYHWFRPIRRNLSVMVTLSLLASSLLLEGNAAFVTN